MIGLIKIRVSFLEIIKYDRSNLNVVIKIYKGNKGNKKNTWYKNFICFLKYKHEFNAKPINDKLIIISFTNGELYFKRNDK